MGEITSRTVEICCRLDSVDVDAMRSIAWDLCKSDTVYDFCYVIHDKDIKDGEAVTPHVHFWLRYANPTRFSSVANTFNVPVNFVNRIKADTNGRGNWDKALPYLCHLNDPDKYQYPVESVFASFDYAEKLKKLEKKQKVKKSSEDKAELSEFLKRIDAGEIDEKTYMLCPEFDGDNLHRLKTWKPYIEAAYKRLHSRDSSRLRDEYEALKAMGITSRRVIYITGPAGVGKSQLACAYALNTLGVTPYVVTSAADPLSEYCNESVTVLDDFRPGTCNFTKYLALFDPFGYSFYVSSRFSNKLFSSLVVLLTCSLAWPSFLQEVRRQNPDEDVKQFTRRFSEVWDIVLDEHSLSGYTVNVYKPGVDLQYTHSFTYPLSLVTARANNYIPMPAPNF